MSKHDNKSLLLVLIITTKSLYTYYIWGEEVAFQVSTYDIEANARQTSELSEVEVRDIRVISSFHASSLKGSNNSFRRTILIYT